MTDFDPFDPNLDLKLGSADPMTSDAYGVAILDKLEEGKAILGENFLEVTDPEKGESDEFSTKFHADIKAKKEILVSNLRIFREQKESKGEKPFFFEPEVRARKAAMDNEKLARYATKLLQADKGTFMAMLEENGDAETYKEDLSFVQDEKFLREEYSTRHLLKQAGYSDRMIDSGVAEPDMRGFLGAKEGESEPTQGAFLRWGLSKVNEIDRRRKITTSAHKESVKQFLGMSGNIDSFEEALESASPDLSNEERTFIRGIRNQNFAMLEKEFSTIKPLVRKTFNTIAREEGVKSKFGGEGDEAFASMDEAIRAMGDVPRKDFPNLVSMMSATAEAHGQDVDGFWTKLGKNFTRGVAGVEDKKNRRLNLASAQIEINRAKRLISGESKDKILVELFNEKGESLGFDSRMATRGAEIGRDSWGDIILGRDIPVAPEDREKIINRDLKRRAQSRQEVFGEVGDRMPTSAKVLTSKEDQKRALEGFEKVERYLEYASAIRDWRETVASVEHKNPFVDTVVYGTFRSLPEMATAVLGVPGMVAIAEAQQERNMAEIRRKYPEDGGKWGKYRDPAFTGAVIYSLLNRAQWKTATKGLTSTESALKRISKVTFLESVIEVGQDLSFATALEVYAGAAYDLKDFPMLPTDKVNWSDGVDWKSGDITPDVKESDGEILKNIKMFPKTMLAMLPIAVAGFAGRKALDKFSDRAYERLINDAELMAIYGIDPYFQAEMRQLSLEDQLDYIRDHNNEFTVNMQEIELFGSKFESNTDGSYSMEGEGDSRGFPEMNARFIAKEDGTFSVTNGASTVLARSPEEAAEAAQQLDPEFSSRVNQAIDAGQTSTNLGENNATQRITSNRLKPQTYSAVDSELSQTTGSEFKQGWKQEEYRATTPEKFTMALDPKRKFSNPLGHPIVTHALLDLLQSAQIYSDIRQGGRVGKKLAKRRILGTYNSRTGLLRVAKHGDVTTVAHELAHALQDQFLYPTIDPVSKKPKNLMSDANWRDDKNLTPAILSDLAKVGAQYYAGGTMAQQLMDNGIIFSEGFAEFIRLKMQGEPMAQIAPDLNKWFEASILAKNPKFAKKFATAQRLIQQYGDQGSLNRGKGNIVSSPTAFGKTAAAALEFAGDWQTKLVESLTPLKRISAEAQRQLGKKLDDVDNPYLLAKRFRMTHTAIVKNMVEQGMQNFIGEFKGSKTSLKYALKDISSKERTDFAVYLWARRTVALNVKRIDSGLDIKDANKIFQKLDSPRYQRAANLVYEWNNNILEYAAESSKDYAAVVKIIRDFGLGDYIPLAREINHIDKNFRSLAPGATSGQLVNKLKGSSRRIRDPFETMISNAEAIVLRSHERVIIEKLLNLSEIPHMGPIITKADIDSVPTAMRGAASLLDEVAKVLDGDLSKATKELAEIVGNSDQADAMVTLWGKAYNPPNQLDHPIIPIYRNGKREFYEVNREAYEALIGLQQYRLPPILDGTIGRANRAWRAGTTAYSVTFQMVTNPGRDFRTLYQQTRSTAGFLRIMGTWGQTMAMGFAEGLSANYFQSEWSKLYDRLGLQMTTNLGQDSQYTQLVTKRLFHGKLMRVVNPNNLGDYLRDAIQYAEKATRLTEIKLVARDIGYNPKTDVLTPEIAQKLALAAREVTTDFSASGTVGKTINQISPFWNAGVQGLRSHIRAYNDASSNKEGKGALHQYAFNSFMVKGYLASIAAIGLWLKNRDEEWWKQMTGQEKYTHSYIPISADMSPSGQDELLRIPRAFELDGFFMGLPVAALDSYYQENPREAVEWAQRVLKSQVPTPPVLGNYFLEEYGKEDFFGRPVIPQSEEVLDVDGERHRQFGPMTTKVGQKLGEIFDLSPRRIDHTIKSFFGRAGLDVVETFGTVEDDIRDPTLARFPILGSFLHPKGQMPYSPRDITEFYEVKDMLQAKASKVNQEIPEAQKERQMRLTFNDASAAMTLVREIRKVTHEEPKIRELQQLELDIATEAMKVFNGGEANRAKFKTWKRRVKATSED